MTFFAMKTKIIGISLVRNEDLFIERVLSNARALCDNIIVADHGSTDRTSDIVQRMMGEDDCIIYKKIKKTLVSHELIREYANTPTWIFPVDGDEIYDPIGLAVLRRKIFQGEFEEFRQIYGNVLHCVELDFQKKLAKGYLSPPSRSMTKLYNFNAIYDWEGPCMEKCLGGKIHFKPDYTENSNCMLMEKMTWEESFFRCLHMVFVKRSSREPDTSVARANVVEIYGAGIIGYWKYRIREMIGLIYSSKYKKKHYCRGGMVEKPITNFWNSDSKCHHTEMC